MSTRSFTRTAAFAGRAIGRKARIDLQPVQRELDMRDRIERNAQVLQDEFQQPLYQHALDGGVGTPLDAHGRRAAPPAEQHIDDRNRSGSSRLSAARDCPAPQP
jgi:hypothetical protein